MSSLTKAIPSDEKEIDNIIRTKLKSNKIGEDQHRMCYHSMVKDDVRQNERIISLFWSLLYFGVVVRAWKGCINVYFYRLEDYEWEDNINGKSEPENKNWFYSYQSIGDETAVFIKDLLRRNLELFYISRFGTEITKAIQRYQEDMEIFVRTRLGQNVFFGVKSNEKHLRICFHSMDKDDVSQNERIISLFKDLLHFRVVVRAWKGCINVYFYRLEDYESPLEDRINGKSEPENKNWFYEYQTGGIGTVAFIKDLLRRNLELFYISRFGKEITKEITKEGLEAYEGLQEREREK